MSARASALILMASLAIGPGTAAFGTELAKSDVEYFETKIRPIFVEHCYSCHSPMKGKVKGGLELDWKGGWEKGGSSGAVIVPGEPSKSRLIQAVQYSDPDLQMPPKGEMLSNEQIAELVQWVKRGAPDPREVRPGEGTVAQKSDGKDHWAFRPVKNPALPVVQHDSWVKNDVDRFVVAKLEANGLAPQPPADKRTLIRRAYYDLIGLPPSPEEVQAFVDDTSPGAFAKVVDDLLASPRYGERWGRHWLDVARYSDSKGQADRRRESSIYPYAWTYRDYVISSFNQDKPYDRFILEQLAADKLSLGTNRNALAALGFLTLGDHFNGNPNEIINDRIDVTSKAFLGLTVACARCHDHKFDPIPQADYYSLHGIFASSAEPLFKPEIADTKASPNYRDYQAKRAQLDARLLNMRTQNMAAVFGDYKRLAGVYLFATHLPEGERAAYLLKLGGETNLIKSWQQVTRAGGRQVASVFGLWNALSKIPETRFSVQAAKVIANTETSDRAREWNPYVVQAFKRTPPRSLAEAAVLYGALFANNDPAWQANLSAILGDAVFRLLPNKQRGQYFGLRDQSDLLEMVHPGAPARAPVLTDSLTPKDSPLFIRGEAENKGALVPRRFLEVLSGPNRPVFRNGSGRLELAEAIANKSNPLTARVMVNRVWMHHFGEGLVTTPDDLGHQSAPPSHPELLDYLATRFMADDWSIKKLHRLLMLSATYQQASKDNLLAAEKDPFNRLLWRANVRRLEFEPLRDSMLWLGGQLDLTVGGHPVDLSEGTRPSQKGMRGMADRVREFRLAGGSRRTIYGYVDRADPLEEFNTFDVASPSASTGKRYETTVPQQALFLMNSPLVIEQVRRVIQRPEFQVEKSAAGRVRFLYQLLFQRLPSDEEIKAGEAFVCHQLPASEETGAGGALPAGADSSSQGIRASATPGHPDKPAHAPTPLGPWQEYAHALLLTNEAAFVE